MAVSAKIYSSFPKRILEADVLGLDISDTVVKCALLTSGYTPSQTSHIDWTDVSAGEITGTGYTAGGATLTSKTVATLTLTTTFDAADVYWTNATFTARYAILYLPTAPVGPAKWLILYVDFGEDKTVTNGTFGINWNSSGIFTAVVA